MRMKIYYFLIWLANKIKIGDYYDFGDQIVAIQVFHDHVYVGTKTGIYRKNKTNDTWKKVS